MSIEVLSAIGAPRQARQTITFTGAAGVGAVGTVNTFTRTGRVWLLGLSAFCTTLLAEAAPTSTISCGTASQTAGLIAVTNAVDIDANEWWQTATPALGLAQMDAIQVDVLLSEDIILTIAAQNVDSGVIVFDAWYLPVTSNGGLVPA